MNGANGNGTRDLDTIKRELRLLVRVRSAYGKRGGVTPSIDQMDVLLDEINEVGGRGKHRWENDNSEIQPSLWR